MARTPKTTRQAPDHGVSSSQRAPSTIESKVGQNTTPVKKTDGSIATRFQPGNTGSGIAGPGVPKKRFDARHYLRRALEMDPSDMAPIPMCAADRIARRIAKTLTGDGIKLNANGEPDELMLYGKSLIDATSTTLGAAYGTLVVTETGDHKSGKDARDHVDSLLAQADELRRQSREAKG